MYGRAWARISACSRGAMCDRSGGERGVSALMESAVVQSGKSKQSCCAAPILGGSRRPRSAARCRVIRWGATDQPAARTLRLPRALPQVGCSSAPQSRIDTARFCYGFAIGPHYLPSSCAGLTIFAHEPQISRAVGVIRLMRLAPQTALAVHRGVGVEQLLPLAFAERVLLRARHPRVVPGQRLVRLWRKGALPASCRYAKACQCTVKFVRAPLRRGQCAA